MKQSDIHHISVHVERSTVMLSVRAATTLPELRAQLVPALAPLARAGHLPSAPSSGDDMQLYEERTVEGAEGAQGVRALDEEDAAGMSVKALGWGRWKQLYVSFRAADGSFPEPTYTVPDPTDGDEE